MLNFDDVFAQIEKLTDLDEDEKNRMSSFCESAIAIVNSRLRVGTDGKDIRLIMAAASLAYYRYHQSLSDENSDMTAMKAGDVTVRRDSSATLKNIRSFCEDMFRDAGELLTDTAFVFTAV